MVERRNEVRAPRDYITDDGAWPHGPFTPDATFPVHEVAGIVSHLIIEIDGRTIQDIAHEAGLSRITVGKVLNGAVWPEYLTLSRIHRVLGLHISQTAGPVPA